NKLVRTLNMNIEDNDAIDILDALAENVLHDLAGIAHLHKLTYTEVWPRQSTFRDSLCHMKFNLAKSSLIKRGIKRSRVVSLQVQRQTEEQQNQGYENDDEQQQSYFSFVY
ncbi:unnamed protein product, partial [Didymodactylos carnosus]